MTRLQAVEQQVKKLTKVSLAAFRQWFLKYDGAMWDEQVEKDIRGGKLAKFSQEALKAHHVGKTGSL